MPDFANPFVAVRLITKDNREFPFWSSLGENVLSALGEDLELKSLAFVQEVSVEWQLAYVPIITVSMSPPFREAVKFLDSELIEWGASTLQVEMGYVGTGSLADRARLFSGVLLKPDVTLGTDVAIVMHAQGIGAWALMRQEGAETADKAPRREYLAQLAKGTSGKIPISLDTSEADADTTAKSLLDAECNHVMGGKSYWESLWEVANEANCTVRCSDDGKTISVIPLAQTLAGQPKRILRLYDFPSGQLGRTDTGAIVYPILSLSSPTTALYLPASVRGFVIQNVSDEDRTAISEVINDATEKPPVSAQGNAAPADTEYLPALDPNSNAGGEFVPGDPRVDAERAAVVSAFLREGNMGIELQIETLGIPDIIPGEVVAVEGVGRRLGGNRWSVFKVQHSVGVSGFSTTLELRSNSENIVRDGVPTAGQPNTKDVEASADGSTSKTTRTNQGV